MLAVRNLETASLCSSRAFWKGGSAIRSLKRAGARPVVLPGRAAVLAHPRVAQRLDPVQVVGAAPQAEDLAVERVRPDAFLEGHVDAAESVDQRREVREAHLDHVVDLHPGQEL